MVITEVKQKVKITAELANQYSKLGKQEKAARLFDKAVIETELLTDKKEQENMYAHLANEFASVDDFDKAIEYLEKITDQEVYVKTTWKLVNKSAKAGKMTLAEKLLAKAVEIANNIEDPYVKVELLTGSGASFRHIEYSRGVGLVNEAYELIATLDDSYNQAILYNEVGANLIDVKEKEKALESFNRAFSLTNNISSPIQIAQVLAMLGGELAEKGEREKAYEYLLKGVDVAATIEENEEKWAVLSEISRNFGQSFKYENGIETADIIKRPFYKVEGYIRVAKNMIKNKLHDEALQLLDKSKLITQEMVDPYEKAVVLRKIISELISLKKNEDALQLLSEVEALYN
ncbi:tetratricopeptide repeat protein [Desulfuribacillus alkaliarsenatis]|uniref:MalT-like TPR region domain-containing protein n=1 Tax=Desulfuribacillus alkaliarsenatis TaxID=766136 RepID=A0A1E5G4M1_9FIRM|nr:hypothetical protein [Desulfuribacillus alkaliarsenatis]OEF98130.1 hypothetical protein BHF68_00100 [Desulfuribacillus alkaliarsenatis]